MTDNQWVFVGYAIWLVGVAVLAGIRKGLQLWPHRPEVIVAISAWPFLLLAAFAAAVGYGIYYTAAAVAAKLTRRRTLPPVARVVSKG